VVARNSNRVVQSLRSASRTEAAAKLSALIRLNLCFAVGKMVGKTLPASSNY